jgi:hypothetical protein
VELYGNRELARVLDHADVGEPDELGMFEIELEAEDQEAALRTVWNAVAATGVDDHILFLDHPDLPEHWRPRARARPDRAGAPGIATPEAPMEG